MKGAVRALAFLMPFVLLVGCGDVYPKPHDFDNTRRYDQSFDETWNHLITFLQKDEFRIANEEKTSNEEKTIGKIDATTSHYSADFADCGTSDWLGLLLGDEFRGLIYVRVVPEGSGTKVWIAISYLITMHTTRGNVIFYCTSTGALEQKILNSL